MSWDFEPQPPEAPKEEVPETVPVQTLPEPPDAVATPAPIDPVSPAAPSRGGWFLRVIGALWLGSGAFLLAVAAPAAFRASDSPTNAANVVGAMLLRWHYIALVLPVILLFIGFRRARVRFVAIVCAAVVLAAAEGGIDLRIRAIRAAAAVPISDLDPGDPVRRHFGLLHGVSSLLLLGQILLAAAAVANDAES